jgi:hypothetical protein
MHTMGRCALTTFLVLAFLSSSRAADWLNHPRWEEGLAEVAVYRGTVSKYGRPRTGSLEVITVREYFDPQKLVKTLPEKGKENQPVMKTNLVKRVRTGVYEYVQMASVFQNRDSGRLLKLSCVSAEWCGNSFALFENRGVGGRLILSNYMDDKGVSLLNLPEGAAVFYDELVPYLRQNLDALRDGIEIRVIDSLLSNNPVYRETSAMLRAEKPVPVVTRPYRGSGTAVVLRMGGDKEKFLFANDTLHTLLRWENGNGEYYQLETVTFLDYWNRNKPGDENLLETKD